MTTVAQAEEVVQLLTELLVILDSQHEVNWSRGLRGAIAELIDENHKVNLEGFETAHSIYTTMVAGGRGFAEYFIWMNDEDKRINANRKLDELRTRIWEVFNS